jgi:hypothetical protein
MLVQGASRCGVPCPECSGVCEGLAAACHTRSVVGGMARSLSTPFSAVIMPGCAHGGCLWSHCQVIVTCLTLGTGRTCSQASMTYCASSYLLSGSSYVTIQAATPPPDLAISSYGPAGPHSGTAHNLQHPQSQQPARSLHGSTLHATVNDHRGTFRSSGHTRQHKSQHCRALPQVTRTSVHTAVATAMQQCCLHFWTTLTTWLRIQAAFKAPSLGTGLSALLLVGSTALSANVAASSAVAAGRVCALITITRCTAAAPGAP